MTTAHAAGVTLNGVCVDAEAVALASSLPPEDVDKLADRAGIGLDAGEEMAENR